MVMTIWKDAIANGTLKITPTSVAQANGIYPNTLAVIDGHPKVGAIVVFQSDTDFALGKAGLDYMTLAKAEGRLDEAWVLFLRKVGNRFEFVNVAPAETIAKIVNGLVTRSGQWGEFWWLPPELEVVAPF
jgi:hypothetical protein